MESRLKKRRIRLAAIVIILLAGVLFAISRWNVEPADYRVSLEKKIEKAEEMLDKARIGNEKGQYTVQAAADFKEQIEAARQVAEDEESYYELLKEACETLDQSMKRFKDSKIKDTQDKVTDSQSQAEGEKDTDTDGEAADNNSVIENIDNSKEKADGSETDKNAGSGNTGNSENSHNPGGSGNTGNAADKGNTGSNGENTGSGNTGDKGNTGDGGDASGKEEMVTVYISIDCNTLTGDGLSNLVDENLAKYVPSDGRILGRTAYKCKAGTSVYEILRNVCRNHGIQMEASYTPLYSGYYVEGINYLYEFHGGTYSGWLYKVNGVFPNYGCSGYFVEEGDEIVWSYTCAEGDVPGEWM